MLIKFSQINSFRMNIFVKYDTATSIANIFTAEQFKSIIIERKEVLPIDT